LTGEILLVLRILLSISLFAFLGWVAWIYWRELQTNAALIASRRVPPLTLLVEPPVGQAEGLSFADPEITIGRDPTCEVFLDDEIISSHHARLSYHHSQWWLEDLHSTNGTRLNDEMVSTATVVIAGDVIACGGFTLTITAPGKGMHPATMVMKRSTGGPDA
jgi:pSer/pThr/pTyr-binding forkhead associated (FHA) protein